MRHQTHLDLCYTTMERPKKRHRPLSLALARTKKQTQTHGSPHSFTAPSSSSPLPKIEPELPLPDHLLTTLSTLPPRSQLHVHIPPTPPIQPISVAAPSAPPTAVAEAAVKSLMAALLPIPGDDTLSDEDAQPFCSFLPPPSPRSLSLGLATSIPTDSTTTTTMMTTTTTSVTSIAPMMLETQAAPPSLSLSFLPTSIASMIQSSPATLPSSILPPTPPPPSDLTLPPEPESESEPKVEGENVDSKIVTDRMVCVPFAELGTEREKEMAVAALALLFQDADVMQHYESGVLGPDAARAKAESSFEVWHERSTRGAMSWWLVTDKSGAAYGTPKVLGAIGFNGEKFTTAEVALVDTAVMLFTEHWRHKVATEAFLSIFKFYLQEGKLPFVNGKCGVGATISPENTASRGLAAALGLTQRDWPQGMPEPSYARDWFQISICNNEQDTQALVTFCDMILDRIAKYVCAQLVAAHPCTVVIHWKSADPTLYPRTLTFVEFALSEEGVAELLPSGLAVEDLVFGAYTTLGSESAKVCPGSVAWIKMRTKTDLCAGIVTELKQEAGEFRGRTSVIVPRSTDAYSRALPGSAELYVRFGYRPAADPDADYVWIPAGPNQGVLSVSNINISSKYTRDPQASAKPPQPPSLTSPSTPLSGPPPMVSAVVSAKVLGQSRYVPLQVMGHGRAANHAVFDPATTKLVLSLWMIDPAGNIPLPIMAHREVMSADEGHPYTVVCMDKILPSVSCVGDVDVVLKVRMCDGVESEVYRGKRGFIHVVCYDESNPRQGSIFAISSNVVGLASRSVLS